MPKLKLYELINPSDPYTFYAPDIKIAYVVSTNIGNGYCARDVETDESTPLLFGHSEWCEEQGINDDYIEGIDWLLVHDAFDSFVIGSVENRRSLDTAMKNMTDNARQNYLAERQESQRSSLNRIGERAYACRDAIKSKMEEHNVN